MSITEYRIKLPKSVLEFVQYCRIQDIQVVMHGSAVNADITNSIPNDYDFYILTTVDNFLEKVEKKLKIKLKKYEEYIIFDQDIYYFINNDQIKIDLIFVDYNSDISQLYVKNYGRVIVTLSSLLFDFKANQLIDKYHGIRDINNKEISCYEIEKALNSPDSVKCFVTYITYLHGKHSNFYLNKKQTPLITQYLMNKTNLRYYAKFSWQRITTLIRALCYPASGIVNILNYWQKTNLIDFFLPQNNVSNREEILTDLNKPPLEKLIQLNSLSDGEILKDFSCHFKKIPISYLDSMPAKAKLILLEIQKINNLN